MRIRAFFRHPVSFCFFLLAEKRAEKEWKIYEKGGWEGFLVAARVEATIKAGSCGLATFYGGIKCPITGRVSPY